LTARGVGRGRHRRRSILAAAALTADRSGRPAADRRPNVWCVGCTLGCASVQSALIAELTPDDWTRLTSLIHGYGSVAAFEQAIGHDARRVTVASPPVDVADIVRTVGPANAGSRPSSRLNARAATQASCRSHL
jgi:hypothetical protein